MKTHTITNTLQGFNAVFCYKLVLEQRGKCDVAMVFKY